MRIAAVGDIHGEEYLESFKKSLNELGLVDLFLLAGDLTDKSDIEVFGKVVEALKKKVHCPIITIFGNEEYSQDHEDYRRRYDLIFLSDQAKIIDIGGRKIRIVGTIGSLDRPTWWQRTNLPNISREYAQRVHVVDKLLEGEEFTILLMHYAPTYETLKGEKEKYWEEMGCRKFEEVLKKRKPNLVIHGHAHNGTKFVELKKEQSTLEDFGERATIPIYNVAFPLVGRITVIEF